MTRKILVALCLFTMLFVQCTTNKKQLLKTSDIPSSFYTIDISKDTEVHTQKGMIMHIPKGTIVSHGTSTVTLEVKEAYSMADMILGGLTTKAGKDLLSSGGMFYVNAAGGSNAQIVHPISISVPTRKQQKGMQLYKGVINSDSSIDWTAPQPLPEQAIDRRMAKSKVLYTDNCASCHSPIKNATGPALALLDKRRDWKWLESFVRNSALIIANGDPYANCIYKQFNKAAMTCYPTLTTEEIHMIFEYADEQAKNIDQEKIYDYKKAYDSCKRYLDAKKALDDLQEKRRGLIMDNRKLTTLKTINNNPAIVNSIGNRNSTSNISANNNTAATKVIAQKSNTQNPTDSNSLSTLKTTNNNQRIANKLNSNSNITARKNTAINYGIAQKSNAQNPNNSSLKDDKQTKNTLTNNNSNTNNSNGTPINGAASGFSSDPNNNKNSTTVDKNSAPSNNSNNSVNPAPRTVRLPQNLVPIPSAQAEYYQVDIETFGWYNIDILLKGLPGFEQSELMVRYIGEFESKVTMYLAIPDKKILLPGGMLKDKSGQYGFYTDDGMIPLPQGFKAYVFAFMEKNGQLYFGKTELVTALKQNLEIKVIATTKEEMTLSIQQMNLEDFDIAVNNSKNADSIRKLDQSIETFENIEKLKPKNFDCNCGLKPISDSGPRNRIMEEDIPENGR